MRLDIISVYFKSSNLKISKVIPLKKHFKEHFKEKPLRLNVPTIKKNVFAL